MTDTIEILQRLSQAAGYAPRQAPGEGAVPYLEGFDVIQTANQIFSYRWSLELLSERRVMLWEQALTTYDRQRCERARPLSRPTVRSRPAASLHALCPGSGMIENQITVEIVTVRLNLPAPDRWCRPRSESCRGSP